MKKFLFIVLLLMPALSFSQTFNYDRVGLVPFVFRADSLQTSADSNWFSIYAPLNMQIVQMEALVKTSDTADFRIALFGTETTAVDSVRILSNSTSTMTVYSNSMTAILAKGSTYRLQYVPRGTASVIYGVALTIWIRFFY